MLVTCKSVAKQERSGKLRGLPTPPTPPNSSPPPVNTPPTSNWNAAISAGSLATEKGV